MKNPIWNLIVIGTSTLIVGSCLSLGSSRAHCADNSPPVSSVSPDPSKPGSVRAKLPQNAPFDAEVEAIPTKERDTNAGLNPEAGSQAGIQIRLRPKKKRVPPVITPQSEESLPKN